MAYACGIAVADHALASTTSILLAAVVVAAWGACLAQSARSIAAAATVVSFAAGFLALRAPLELSARPSLAAEHEVTLEATICSLRAAEDFVDVLLCEAQAVDPPDPIPERIRLVESRDRAEMQWWAQLLPGERIRAALRLRPHRRLGNPGQRSRGAADRRRGIAAMARTSNAALGVRLSRRGDVQPNLGLPLSKLRQAIAKRLRAEGRGGALLAALAVGDRSALARKDRESFVRLGIAHLLAVSGLHLAMLAGGAYALALALAVRLTPLSSRFDVRGGAGTLAFFAACLYAGLAGWGVPVQRALVFLGVAGVARGLDRAPPPTHVISVAGLAVLALDPASLFEPGAQLSFVASTALLFAVFEADSMLDGSDSRRSRAVVAAGMMLRVSAIATAVTAPILAFHEMPVVSSGLLANGLAVPFTSLILLPLALASAAAAWIGGVIASSVIPIAAAVASAFLSAAEFFARGLPEATARNAPQWVFLLAAICLAAVTLRTRRTFTRVALALCVVTLLRLAPAPSVGPAPPRIVVLDVGLGDAILIEGRAGSMLVDGALALPDGLDLGRSIVVPALQALGVAGLDVVVATHADADHRGGLLAVLETLPVTELWLPAHASDDAGFRLLRAAAQRRGVRVIERALGDTPQQRGDLRIETLWPPRDESLRSRNDASLVLRVEVAGQRLLLTGDIGRKVELELLHRGLVLSADLLKVAHHGSRSASSPTFLAAVDADVALLSAPCSRRSRLPARESLARLKRSGATTWWTGRSGALFVALGRPQLAVWGGLSEPNGGCGER